MVNALGVVVDGVRFEDTSMGRFIVEPDGLKGWFESVGVRREDADRPHGHGSFGARGWRGGRLISMSGSVITSSIPEQESAFSSLTGILAEGGDGVMSVETPAGVTSTRVQLNAAPDIRIVSLGVAARFQLEFWAPDPRRYGEKRTFPGGTSVVPYHRGNFPAVPRVVVSSGFANGFRVVYGDRVFEVDRATFWQQAPLEIDMRTGWVWQGGSLLRGVIRRAETFEIPSHNQEPVRLVGSGSGSGRVSVELRDTWI